MEKLLMDLGNEDKLEFIMALLDLLICCDDNTNIQSVNNTALLALCLVKDLKPEVLQDYAVAE
jgi:hypothetical protein